MTQSHDLLNSATHTSGQFTAVVLGAICAIVIAKPVEQFSLLELVLVIHWDGGETGMERTMGKC